MKERKIYEKKRVFMSDLAAYLVENATSPLRSRLLAILQTFFCDRDGNYEVCYVEDIAKNEFLEMDNATEIVWKEFKVVRAEYLRKKKGNWGGSRKGAGRKSKTYDGKPKKMGGFWLRSDIYETLQKIEDKPYFVEMALLEKFERDGIKLEGTKKDAD